MDAIQTEGLTKVFGDHRAIDGLTFSVKAGELFGLVGPDGAGKTTTMRLLSSIMEPTDGDAWVSGYHIVKEPEEIKARIGYMSQRFGLYPDLTVDENIDFYGDIYGVSRRNRRERVDRLLSFSNLAPFRKRFAGNLSGGMKQKLGLVCALVHTPAVLFLDEPTNGVDPVSRRDFWRILYSLLRENVTIFVSTAYLDEAERCNRLGLLHEGRLLACGSPDEIKDQLKGSLLEVRVSDPRHAVQAFRRELGSTSVSRFGDRLHVLTSNATQATELIEVICAREGLALERVAHAEPSLEDVFVSVLARRPNGVSDGDSAL